MRRLVWPSFDDDKRQTQLASRRGVGPLQLSKWQAAYKAYRKSQGNPFKVLPYKKSAKLEALLYRIYDDTNQTKAIKAIRDWSLSTCPMCGAAGVGTVDHYLPRETYPEFSVFTPNLIPACNLCNSKAKKTTVKGTTASERFLHPYFNKLMKRDLWLVRFDIQGAAVSFKAEPLPSLSPSVAKRVQWHLDNVLEAQFHNLMRSQWADHARGLNHALAAQGGGSMTAAFVRAHTELLLGFAATGEKHNSWPAAFYRGLLADPVAIEWMETEGPSVL